MPEIARSDIPKVDHVSCACTVREDNTGWGVHQFLNVSRPKCLLSRFSGSAHPKKIPGKTFGPNWSNRDKSLAEIGCYSTIAPNEITGPLSGTPPITWCIPINQEILNVSQIAMTLRRIKPPFFVHTWLQQHCFFFVLRTCSQQFPFVSDLCRDNIHWFQENFHKFCPILGRIVSVTDIWFPRPLQNVVHRNDWKKRFHVLENFHLPSSWNFSGHSGRSRDESLRAFLLILSLFVDAGCSVTVTVSCNEDVEKYVGML